MAQLLYRDQYIMFFISYRSEKNKYINKIIISKHNIKKAVQRNRMRRKIRFLCKTLNFNDNICCKVIVTLFHEFKIQEYKLIKKKIIKNAHRDCIYQ